MNKLKSAMYGLLVGDALGVPFEFLERGSFRCNDMTGYGTYYQPPGTFSDDSSMALATLDSINRKGKIDAEGIADAFIDWLYENKYTQYDAVFDVGGTTRQALTKYKKTGDINTCGQKDVLSNGNGSLMRILPVAFFKHTDEDVEKVSSITHANEISLEACKIYVHIVERLIEGWHKYNAVESATVLYINSHCFSRLREIAKCDESQIKSTGYVVDSLEAALWCFLTTDSYKECVLKAVNLGNDTDTIAAIAGGLAGLYYGIGGKCGIPKKWIRTTVNRKWIKNIIKCKETNE